MLDTGKSSTVKNKIFGNLLHKTPLQQKKFDQITAKKNQKQGHNFRRVLCQGQCVWQQFDSHEPSRLQCKHPCSPTFPHPTTSLHLRSLSGSSCTCPNVSHTCRWSLFKLQSLCGYNSHTVHLTRMSQQLALKNKSHQNLCSFSGRQWKKPSLPSIGNIGDDMNRLKSKGICWPENSRYIPKVQ